MARPAQRLAANTAGPFYVDASCIDCGTCWQWDPAHFAPTGSTSHVHAQPQGEAELRAALLALQACPVAAIGTTPELLRRTPADGFPALITQHPAGDVYYCGWASRRSFGASSWLIERPGGGGGVGAGGGNVMIDSPRFNAPLARRIEAMGGLAAIVLSHRDDVADQDRWARHFGCPRWIHAADADAAPQAEHRLEGLSPMDLGGGLQLIPTPGHTAGSMVAVLGEAGAAGAGQILFSGDHLWWSPQRQVVVASRRFNWWNWEEQIRSVERLLELDVRWLLPGHGDRHAFAPGEWRIELERTLAWCRAGADLPERAASTATPSPGTSSRL
jgi:glyoxylase-like metal-dependent hydrolase (beta-lactamase superfamily II)/ferredoxin